jgi:hypothetical protein
VKKIIALACLALTACGIFDSSQRIRADLPAVKNDEDAKEAAYNALKAEAQKLCGKQIDIPREDIVIVVVQREGDYPKGYSATTKIRCK